MIGSHRKLQLVHGKVHQHPTRLVHLKNWRTTAVRMSALHWIGEVFPPIETTSF